MPMPRFLRFRYSLRALFIFITLFSLWGGYHGNRAYRERKAETALKAAGVMIRRAPRASMWLYRFIFEVRLESEFSPVIVEALGDLPYLNKLYSIAPASTREGQHYESPARASMPNWAMDWVDDSRQLRHLALEGWEVADGTCAAIARSDALNELELTDCELSEDGFARLVLLTRLHSLRASSCPVTGVKLATAIGSKSLREVTSLGCPVTPEFATFLSKCPNLTTLSLTDAFLGSKSARIGDAFVTRLGAHESIQYLSLSGTSVTNASIPILGRMPALECISLPANFSPSAKQSLKAVNQKLRMDM